MEKQRRVDLVRSMRSQAITETYHRTLEPRPSEVPATEVPIDDPEWDRHVQWVVDRQHRARQARDAVTLARTRLASVLDSRVIGEAGHSDVSRAEHDLYVALDTLNAIERERPETV